MVTIKLLGGLGNQLFQRAYGAALTYRGYEVGFDTSALVEGTHREYSLDSFLIRTPLAQSSYPIVYEKGLRFNESMLTPPNPSTIVGYFQTERYFSDISAWIRYRFTLTGEVAEQAEDIRRQIVNSHSAFLHVRRQDYVGLEHFHGMPTMEYYRRAVAEIRSRVPDLKVFVFSDDREWCLQNFLGYEVVQGTNKYEDLWLMEHCQHAILANSSFSWWAAWLGDIRPNRIVIAPKRWFADSNVDASDIVPERWIRL